MDEDIESKKRESKRSRSKFRTIRFSLENDKQEICTLNESKLKNGKLNIKNYLKYNKTKDK